MRIRQVRITRTLALAVVATGLMAAGCGEGVRDDARRLPIAVRVVSAVRTDLREQVEFLGTFRSRQAITVFAQVQGTVTTLPVAEGSPVHAKNVIVRIDAPELAAAVERLQADNDYWQRRHASNERLFAQSAISEEVVEMSRRASRSSAAALKETKSRLEKTVERSPISGEILKWFVEPGQHVMPGQPLVLVGTGEKEIVLEVAEEDLHYGIATGTTALILAPSGDSLVSHVAEIAPLSSRVARTYTVTVPAPPRLGDQLRDGASISVHLILQFRLDVVAVPGNAIRGEGDDARVYVIRDRTAFERRIRTGVRESRWVEVPEGTVQPGDEVAVSNLNQLQDSVLVFPVTMKGRVR